MNIVELFRSLSAFVHEAQYRISIYTEALQNYEIWAIVWTICAAVGGTIAISTINEIIHKAKRHIKDTDESATAYGSARLAEPDEIESAGMLHDGKKRMIFGSYGGRYVAPPHRIPHALISAPTGAGKGVGIILPTLLKYEGSVVTNDPKAENLAITGRHREENLGQTLVVFDPWGSALKISNRHTNHFNPLVYIDISSIKAVAQVRLLLRLVCGDKIDGGANQYFYLSAEGLVEFMILFVCAKHKGQPECNLVTVSKYIDASIDTMTSILTDALEMKECRGLIQQIATKYLSIYIDRKNGDYSEKFESFRSNASNYLVFLHDLELREFFKHNDCDLSNPQGNLSIFVIVSPDLEEGVDVFQRLVYGTIMQNQFQNYDNDETPLLFIFDEVVKMGYFKALKRGISITRSYAMRFLIITQNIEQLKEHYGEHGASEIENNSMFVSFSPVSQTTQENISKRLGNKTIQVKSETISNGKKSITKSYVGRPLLTPDEVARTGITKVFAFGWNNRAALVDRITYYKDSRFRSLYDKNNKLAQKINASHEKEVTALKAL